MKSPAASRTRRSAANTASRSDAASASRPNPAAISSSVASAATRRPGPVIAASTPRPSVGLRRRVTRPCPTSRSTMFVALVGCTINRSPITRIGSSPSRLKDSSTSASYRAKVNS
nr:hypothetical protein [Actinocatenispora thailandica]